MYETLTVVLVACVEAGKKLSFHFLPFSLVFSQSLISLDLIEDFLEMASREPEEDKPVIYKGKYKNVNS